MASPAPHGKRSVKPESQTNEFRKVKIARGRRRQHWRGNWTHRQRNGEANKGEAQTSEGQEKTTLEGEIGLTDREMTKQTNEKELEKQQRRGGEVGERDRKAGCVRCIGCRTTDDKFKSCSWVVY